MSAQSTIVYVENGDDENVHVFTESFDPEDNVYIEQWFSDMDKVDGVRSEQICISRPMWDKLVVAVKEIRDTG